jgi:hypothetical protein
MQSNYFVETAKCNDTDVNKLFRMARLSTSERSLLSMGHQRSFKGMTAFHALERRTFGNAETEYSRTSRE